MLELKPVKTTNNKKQYNKIKISTLNKFQNITI